MFIQRQVAFSDPLFRAIKLSGLRDGWIREVSRRDN